VIGFSNIQKTSFELMSKRQLISWSARLLNKHLAQAKALLRDMRQTVEDIEDARTIERAKRANGNKSRIPWAQVKEQLQLE
jgi:hypothetical protein